MSDKLTCPSCGSLSWSVNFAVKDRDPCPGCGLPPEEICRGLSTEELMEIAERGNPANQEIHDRLIALEREARTEGSG